MAPKASPFGEKGVDDQPLIPAKLANGEVNAAEPKLPRVKSKLPSIVDLTSLPRGLSASLPRIASNPLKMGIPKRVPSLNTQVEARCKDLGGVRAIHSVLVANNGIAAVKFIRGIRSWAYKTFGNERAVALVAMATPEDMRIDAEHIRMADQFVEVPGGSNNNNYANVALIVQVADRANVDAVWPGWGHASEKPELPQALSELPSGIRFLGPPAGPMAALGDKIGSTILAQAAGVPTIPWSGSGVAVDFSSCGGVIPPDVYEAACIHSLQQALDCCKTIGYPIMLKASWGGGGKGIRKCLNDDDVRASYKQVLGEVPGSPIFAMKLAAASRHLEVQLLCDEHGNVTSIFSRDCSVQRRHQKVVEEGPVTKAPPETLKEMERCARALARSVSYVGAATVEYLFDLETGKYYFLELNPRLQVEHPVTEWISNVNIPACQLLIGMGVPLYRIPDIRRLFGKDPGGLSPIDFEADPQVAPSGHVVAVRVTSEDADDGFKPTCGSIDEISFRPSPDVWGYFSVKSGGGIHEFSDSQFGHLFAKGDTREAAIRAMVVALKEIRIRGEIRTVLDYAVEMIQSPDFVGNNIHTGWLDGRIASHVKAEKPVWYLGVIAGAVLRTMDVVACGCAEYLGYLQKGQLPPARLSLTTFRQTVVLEGMKYEVDVVRRGPQEFWLQLGSSAVNVVCRKLNDGGLLIQVDGQAHVVHSEEEPLGTRLTIDSLTCLLANETDPSRLVAASPGKLVRYLIDEGCHVTKDQPYAEIEVMKMVMTLLAPAPGRVRFQQVEGALLAPGDIIARLDLDDPAAVQAVTPYTGSFPELGPPLVHSSRSDQRFKAAFQAAKNILQGFENSVSGVMEDLLSSLDNPSLAMLQWDEVFSVVQTRLPAELAAKLQDITASFEEELAQQCLREEGDTSESDAPFGQLIFPSLELLAVIEEAIQGVAAADRAALESQVESLQKLARAHQGGNASYARGIVEELFRDFLDVEERFAADEEATEQEVIDSMRREYSDNLGKVVDIVVSHQGLPTKLALVTQLMSSLVLPAPEHFRPLLRRFAALGNGSAEAASRAKQLLEQSLMSELRAVVARALSGLEMFSGSQLSELDLLAPVASLADADKVETDGDRSLVRSSTIMEGLYTGLGTTAALQLDAKIKLLVEAPAAVEDALASLLDHHDVTLQHRALVTYIKRVYYPFVVREPELGSAGGHLCAFWLHSPTVDCGLEASGSVILGVALVIPTLEELATALTAAERLVGDSVIGDCERGTLHVVLTHSGDANEAVEARAQALAPQLASAGFSSLSVLGRRRGQLLPVRLGFWREGDAYVADPLLAAVEPAGAEMLELRKLRGLGARVVHNASRNRQCHTYAVTERKDARSLALRRVFARAVVRQLGKPALLAATYKADAAGIAAAAVEEVDASLANCLHELERLALASREQQAMKADWAHVFLSVLPPLPLSASKDEARIALALKSACASLVARWAPAMRRAAVAQLEVRLRVQDASGAWRLVLSSPTGHEAGEDSVAVYRESTAPTSRYVSKHNKCEEAGPLDGTPVAKPYAPLEGLQQKRLAARRHKTTYCYDFPSVFGTALRDIWNARAAAGEPGSMPQGPLVEVQELVAPSGGLFSAAMVPTDRPSGQNDVGIVAWLLTLKTPECPQGRQVVAVANDITFSSGAFGPREDAAFKAATDYSLEERLPLIYLAANSGARVGLANEIKQKLRVEWVNPQDPTKGFKYLYLTDEDYQAANSRSRDPVVAASATTVQGERRWVLSDVVGTEDGLGVECLSGSAAIAAAYSRAFREGLTMTLVSGRTVGIGAYLARLGRRCIQRADQPIILTGFAALNKLLGREVYTSHMQLGGPKVMGVNGVSHHVVADDLEGVTALLQWLSTMPTVIGGVPLALPSADPTDRPVTYAPAPGEKLDPRAAISGPGGLFDRNTWREASSGWARSVVTGRARLAGVPVGIIAVETSTVMLNIPADPGAPDSAERVVPQAGQVWFPDSALKTAHALEEFDREGLPLIILANWRGFSGGQRDLFEGVLQAGSLIVENLRTYRQPVFVYLPPGAELRGGAWVVIDGQINSQQVEMYADPAARGGVLEPEGIVEIKFRTPELLAAMGRLDPVLLKLKQSGAGKEEEIKAREAALLPIYRQMAVAFAEMHDTPVRMAAKGVLNGVVPWRDARAFLARRLKRRMAEEEILKHITTTDDRIQRQAALELLRTWYFGGHRAARQGNSPREPRPEDRVLVASPRELVAWKNDSAFLAWVEGAGAIVIASELKALRARAASRALVGLTTTAEGRDGLLHGLATVLRNDAALRAQVAALLAKQLQIQQAEGATPRRSRMSQDSSRRWSRESGDLAAPSNPANSAG